MKKIYLIIFLLTTLGSFSQEKFTITGTVKDANSGETLIGVSIIEKNSSQGTVTNEYGFYSFTLTKGVHTIEISYMGYDLYKTKVQLTENKELNIDLQESTESLEEVVISAYTEKISIKKAEMSVNKMKVQTIKEIPAVLGEVDVLKSIVTLPGVTNAGEGQSGFNVRGGAADQNLVLLDEATLFNSSHLFGFFSVINADAIKDLKLYKGGIPSKFGGRISSVLDIHQKDGNKYEFHGNGGIGLLSSRLTLEGPIQKKKASFFVSGRRSYADLFLPIVQPDNKSKAYFYDLNTKVNWEVDSKNKLYLSGYFGRDIFSLGTTFVNEYGNAVANLRWNHIFNSQLFSNLSLIYSNYYYGLEISVAGFQWDSGLENYNLKYDLKQYFNDDIAINYGVQAINYVFNPGKIQPSEPGTGIETNQIAKKYAIENAIYVDVEHQLNENIDLRYGVRWSNFLRLGESEINVYNGSPVLYNEDTKLYEQATPIGQVDMDKSKVRKTFNNLEPRFSIAYALNNKSSFKASYQRMAQYIHILSNTQSPTPLDIWTPSGEYIKPQLSDQIAFGYSRDFNNMYSLTAEIFGKTVKNRIDYIDGAELVAQEAIESVILNGKARAYGLELMFKKEEGKFNGWISYTLSRSEQQTTGRTADEVGINNGNWYATGYDKTHDLTVIANYKASKKWKFNSSFNLQTGQPVTYADGSYGYLGLNIPNYGPRNSKRLPLYHRVDVSATYVPEKYESKKWKGEWVFSVYNLYNRQNASSISFGQDENNETGTTRNITERLTMFGIIPSVTFNFKF
ncbi:TonB-dependent receptor [Wenyingzhuangia sp. 2_MG-2023]|uniref:TonB-dependent receptor n=1 Tax=Wenyingzhuangia sp. 2_MG-2023 TaxID=3062639 RepID=UPI0026E23679|nr:TonB-dependent receptor [Wenyingzhuangia sp. 2_MG-2023]MDO6738876.1 TonB-dependent receptor [Wenyingzhuangia sp. 2_MG-2023]